METVESGWNKGNLLKLLAALKASVPGRESGSIYRQGLKAIDWNEVAFSPFSPEECQEKWTSIMQKMRKIRTLPELIVEAEEVISNPSRNFKIHPEYPKKPIPPTAAYCEENLAKFRKENPKLRTTKVFKFAVEQFNQLSNDEKTEYGRNYDLATEEYGRMMEDFREKYAEASSELLVPTKIRKKKKKGPADRQNKDCTEDGVSLPPKPVPNGYALFCQEQPKSIHFKGPSQKLMTVWASGWRDLSDAKKAEYKNRCKEMRRQYLIKMDKYLGGFDKEEQQKILKENGIGKLKMKKTRTVKHVKRSSSEPKMPPTTVHKIFCEEQLQLLKEKMSNSKERLVQANKLWWKLSAMEKERLKAKLDVKMKKYAVELQRWFKTLKPEEQADYRARNPSRLKYLEDQPKKMCNKKEPQPSDSEDEEIVISSSDSEGHILDLEMEEEEEEEEEEEDDIIMFEIF
ncbi:nucleolar transcription factor 1-like [Odontesthes bonariensis]|uniref:nucleolar transcription factor 1-like n=1 Tax=Odontesthes bonariensis TaxID=219752 RepID=UPI003F58E8AF